MQEVVSSSPCVAKSVWPMPKYLGGSRKFPDEVVGFCKNSVGILFVNLNKINEV